MIRFVRRLHAALYYHVLAHLDLGRDAASLHDPRLPIDKPWLAPLRAAYDADPGRLGAHHAPLLVHDLAGLLNAVDHAEVRGLGAPLCHALAAAARAEAPDFAGRWHAATAEHEARAAEVQAAIDAPLSLLRAALWAQIDRDPPPLRVIDCRALRRHGRAASLDGERVVAVSLGEAPEHILCQVLHEETHPISDRLAGRATDRDTRPGTPGHATHRRLEWAAVALGQRVVDAVAPEWSAAYEAWVARQR